jgi:hypothetical protein
MVELLYGHSAAKMGKGRDAAHNMGPTMRCFVPELPLSKPDWLGSGTVVDYLVAVRLLLNHDGTSGFGV